MEVATAPKGPPNSYTKAASLPPWAAATAAAVVLVVVDDLLREGVVLFDLERLLFALVTFGLLVDAFFGDFDAFLAGDFFGADCFAEVFFADARAANALAALLLMAGDFFGDFFLTGVLARDFFAAANALVALLLTEGVVDFFFGVAFFLSVDFLDLVVVVAAADAPALLRVRVERRSILRVSINLLWVAVIYLKFEFTALIPAYITAQLLQREDWSASLTTQFRLRAI